jgi:hypothetical protein
MKFRHPVPKGVDHLVFDDRTYAFLRHVKDRFTGLTFTTATENGVLHLVAHIVYEGPKVQADWPGVMETDADPA